MTDEKNIKFEMCHVPTPTSPKNLIIPNNKLNPLFSAHILEPQTLKLLQLPSAGQFV